MHSLSLWVTQHGYIALAIGALFEGETALPGICCGLGGLFGMAAVAWLREAHHRGAEVLLAALVIAGVGIAARSRRAR